MNKNRFRITLIVIIACLTILLGVRTTIWQDQQTFDLFISLAFSIAFSLLCKIDAAILKKQVLRVFLAFVFFGWPVMFPLYLIWSRGLKGILLNLGTVIGFIILFGIGSISTLMIIQGLQN